MLIDRIILFRVDAEMLAPRINNTLCHNQVRPAFCEDFINRLAFCYLHKNASAQKGGVRKSSDRINQLVWYGGYRWRSQSVLVILHFFGLYQELIKSYNIAHTPGIIGE